jgi:hypothetical protein
MQQERFHAFIGGMAVRKRKTRGTYKRLSVAERDALWAASRAGVGAAGIGTTLSSADAMLSWKAAASSAT